MISSRVEETAEDLGGKALGLVLLHRLGLRVPDGFVVTAQACHVFLREGRLPEDLRDEFATAVTDLEHRTGRVFGARERPLAVSVRSGAPVSMPGMLTTILNLGLTPEAPEAPEAAPGERSAAADSRLRPLERAVEAVFASWNAPRARTYRVLNDIPEDLGTAVIVQAMVFGNKDARSGSGVAFSRDPNTGENVPFGEVLFERQGTDVVSGGATTRPLHELAEREPAVWAELCDALRRIERHYRDACYVEFTYEAGELWFLQVRPGRFGGAAAVRLAVELVDEGVIERREALLRVSPRHLQHARTPRLDSAEAEILARGIGACPGVASGRVVTSSDEAARMAAAGVPVILVRPETSPDDMRGLAVATGIVTARGGPASHAAVVARSMGKPAVVGVGGLAFDAANGSATIADRLLTPDTVLTIDGTSGDVAAGTPRVLLSPAGTHLQRFLSWSESVTGTTTGPAGPTA
ncbi:PEP/pyruvate-binding domain-containing protein [Actinocorallia populi]|uniref:PEP/pyruvate-binding domain-containing protein n=1 Tax=Actinocorallia populi TaxID=2079200 RepID=UPI001E2CF927|nr:PEP/pyruvate-binding domain-containing protein [Actinocorallia populi]